MFLISELAFTLQSIAVSYLSWTERTSYIMKNTLKSPMQTSTCDIRQISSGSPSVCSFISYSHGIRCLEICSLEYNSHLTTEPFSPVSPKPIQENLATTTQHCNKSCYNCRPVSESSFKDYIRSQFYSNKIITIKRDIKTLRL